MNTPIDQQLARRRRRRLVFAGLSLALYFSYSLQWVFDVRSWISDGTVSMYFPIVVFFVLIIAMCALEFIHFYIEDHDHDSDQDKVAAANQEKNSAIEDTSEGGDRV